MKRNSTTGKHGCYPCTYSDSKNVHCNNCEDFTGKCTECQTGYRPTKEGFCRKDCESYEYWMGKSDNICRECQVEVANCSTCEDITGDCLRCSVDLHFYNKSFCVPHCKNEEFFSLDDPEKKTYVCKNCTSLDSNGKGCTRCQNFTGECLECSEGYEIMKPAFCKKKCQEKGWHWSGKDKNICLKCGSYCLRCSDIDGKCTECLPGYIIMGDGKSCEPYFPAKNIPEEETPKLLLQYFDKVQVALVTVFDKKVTEENIPTNYEEFEVNLTQNGTKITM